MTRIALSEANSFAIEVHAPRSGGGGSWSASAHASYSSARAAAVPVCMSASLNWIPCMLDDRPAEGDALARVGDGVVGRALRDADRLRGGAEA